MTGSRQRRCLPVDAWPPRDRAAWNAAISATDDVLGLAGPGAHWRHNTRRSMIAAYGRWLSFLANQGVLDPDASPESRVTEANLRAYIEMLSAEVAPVTRANRIRDLRVALKAMVPGFDDTLLRRLAQRLKSRARPLRDAFATPASHEDLVMLGMDLLMRAESGSIERPDWRACTYRDGVIILMLTARPLRRANMAGLVLGETILEDGTGFRIALPGEQMKNHRDYRTALPDMLVPFLRRYLDHYRPVLLRGQESDHLWISSRGRTLDDSSLSHKIVKHTKDAFGVAISPHRFRDAVVTRLGEEHPELIRLGSTLLHHIDPRTTEQHYNKARSDHAVARYQAVVEERRQRKHASGRS